MLNSHLIEYFGSLHRRQGSGVLTVIGPNLRLRFCFESGNPVAVDLGADKELVLADELLHQHKIDADTHASLTQQHLAGAGTVADLARTSGSASDDDISAATRGMVETALIRCFGSTHYDVTVDEHLDVSSFDFNSSAIRLRIATTQLLSTVQNRIQEQDRITAAVPANAIFGLEESTAGAPSLDDREHVVLDLIDGRSTVEEIACAWRESTTATARVIQALVTKGLIKLVRLAVIQTEIPSLSPRRSTTTDSLYVSPPTTEANPWPLRIALLVVLMLVVLIGIGVWSTRSAQSAYDEVLSQLNQDIASRAWADAANQVSVAERNAGNDLAAITAARRLKHHLEKSLATEQQNIATAIDQGRFDEARGWCAKLPNDETAADLGRRLKKAEDAASERLTQMEERVQITLTAGRSAEAVSLIANAEKQMQPALRKTLERWRDTQLDQAVMARTGYADRQRLVAQIAAAEPTDAQKDRLGVIRSALEAEQKRLTKVIAELTTMAETGAFSEFSDIWEQERLSETVRGSDLGDAAEKAKQTNDQSKETLTRLLDKARSLLSDSDDADAMREQVAIINNSLSQQKAASNRASLADAATLLPLVAATIHDGTFADEIKLLNSMSLEQTRTTESKTAIRQRIARMEAVEKAATETLERARAFGRQENWDQTRLVLQDLCARPEWRKTAARLTAIQELNAAKNLTQQRAVWQQDLERALVKGDTDQALIIARKMGLRYLPLRIETTPPGADIKRDGAVIGTSPMILDIPASERSGLQLELAKAGFVTSNVDAGTAESGWKIARRLERASSDRQQLNLSLSITPMVADGRVWFGNRQSIVAYAPGRDVERWTLDAGSSELAQPLYAPISINDGAAWVTTREGLAMRVALDRSSANLRIAIPTPTKLAVTIHTSAFVIGRTSIILAGSDGILRAYDAGNSSVIWSSPTGAPFVMTPWRKSDDLLITVRQDGRIERWNPDDGRLLGSDDVRGQVGGAWTDSAGLHLLASGCQWLWNGTSLSKDELPAPAVIGSEGVFISNDNHVFLRDADAWKDLGRIDSKPTVPPIRWAGHAVVVSGQHLAVFGSKPFVSDAPAEFLAPVVLGEQLVVPCANGVVSTYQP